MPTSKIVTVTLNPAVDRSGVVQELRPSEKLRCTNEHCHPGGGGINVARVLTRFNVDVIAVFPVGGYTGELLKSMIEAEKVRYSSIDVPGSTRENVSIRSNADGQQYRFVFPGAEMSIADIERCCDLALSHVARDSYIVISGSLPPGAPVDTYAKLATRASKIGAHVALDSSGAAFVQCLGPALSIFKLNEEELGNISGAPVYDRERCIAAARQLLAAGPKMAAITRGAKGAILVTASEAWDAGAPLVHAISSIGAGDTFLAILIEALSRGQTPEVGLRHAVAAASAALLTEGTGLAWPEKMRSFISQIPVESIHLLTETQMHQ